MHKLQLYCCIQLEPVLKIRNTATPACLNRHIQSCDCVRNLRSSGTPLLARPSRKTDFAARGFRHSAPAVWNSLPKTMLDSSSLTVFKSRLKSRLFHLAYNDWHDLTCSATAMYYYYYWRWCTVTLAVCLGQGTRLRRCCDVWYVMWSYMICWIMSSTDH